MSVWCLFAHNSTMKSRNTKIGRNIFRVTPHILHQFQDQKVKVNRLLWWLFQVTISRGWVILWRPHYRLHSLCIITGRMPQNGKLPVLNLLTGRKSGFSPPRGDSYQFRSNLARPTGTWVRLAVQHFTSIGAGGGNAAPKYQKFPLFGKESPYRGKPLDRFLKFLGVFIWLTMLHQCFKFDMIRFTGYRIIAEKPCIGQLRRIFLCTL